MIMCRGLQSLRTPAGRENVRCLSELTALFNHSDDILPERLQRSDGLWVGYSINEGTWRWSDGETNGTRQLKWEGGEPSDGTMHAAVYFNKTSHEVKMKSFPPDSSLGYICEKYQKLS